MLWLTLVVVCWLFSTANADCSYDVGSIISFDDALSNCIRQVPFDSETFDATLSTVENTVPLYVFVDIAKDSPDQENIPMQIDLEAELEKIRGTTYSCDYDFHRDIQDLFRGLHDGHTYYGMPTCYGDIQPMQPLMLASYYDSDSGVQVIFVAGIYSGMTDAYNTLFGIDLSSYVGATVVKIDGEKAVDYIFNFANSSVGTSKDVQTRFNIALTRYTSNTTFNVGAFYSRSSSPAPKTGETVTYLVEDTSGTQTTLTLPWVGKINVQLDSLDDFKNLCYSSSSKREAHKVSQSLESHVEHISDSHHLAVPTPNDIEPLLIYSSVSFYKLTENTAVMVVPSFEPSSYVEFGKGLEQGLALLAANNLHRLIIDLSNNGGGDLCLGYTLVELLFKEFSPYGANDMIHSTLAVTLAEDAVALGVTDTYWSPEYWTSFDDNATFPDNTDWFIPGIPHLRGGVANNYSEYFRDACDLYFEHLQTPDGVNYKPSQIRLLSNGYCGSTCAVFSRHMQEFDGVKTVTVGGLYDSTQGIATTPGGQVVDVPSVVTMIEELGEASNPLAPQNFVTTATLHFTLREIYPWDQDTYEVPLEYLYEPSDYHIGYTKASAVNPQLVWKDVLLTFWK